MGTFVSRTFHSFYIASLSFTISPSSSSSTLQIHTHTHQTHRPTRPPPASNSVLIIHRLNEIPALNLYGPSVGYKDSTPCLLAAWAYAKEGTETTSPAAIAEASIIQSAESINRIWVLIEFRFNLSLPLLLLSTHTSSLNPLAIPLLLQLLHAGQPPSLLLDF